MYIGNQRCRIEIWRNVVSGQNEYGESVVTPTLWKKTWARMAARRGNEHNVGSEIVALTHWLFTTRYMSVKGIQPDFWIIHEGQRYDIRNIMPDEQKHDECVIEARIRNVNMQDEGGGEEPEPITITMPSAPDIGYVNELYVAPAPVVTAIEPVTFAIDGALPPGLAINSATGIISGTPTVSGSYTFKIVATAGESSADVEVTIEIQI